MVELKMSTKNTRPNQPSESINVGDVREEESQRGVIRKKDMCYSYSNVSELRESGEWTLVGCKCSMTSTSSSINDEKLICTCKTPSNIPADCSSNCSSSDVAVINESDGDEPSETEVNDLDGIPRISSLNLSSINSPLTSITDSVTSLTTDDNNVDISKRSLSSCRLRLRLKKSSSNQKTDFDEVIASRPSLEDKKKASNYKRSLKKTTQRIFITNEGVLTLDRTTIIVAILCLIILFFGLAVLCLFFTFISSKTLEKIEPSPVKGSHLAQIEDMEKEFSDCLKSNQKDLDCGRNLKFWKNSLAELLSNENERIKNLILKLEEIGESPEQLNTVAEEMEKAEELELPIKVDNNKIDSSENPMDSGHYEDRGTFDHSIKNIPHNQADSETIESLRNQMETLKNLYNLEKSETLKWKKLYEKSVLQEEGDYLISQETLEQVQEEEERKDETKDDYINENVFPNYDAIWKGFKNLNPNLEKFHVKLSKVMVGARQLGEKLRKKLTKNTEKLSKKLEKLRKAWNEEDDCYLGNCDLTPGREMAKESSDKLQDEAQWYTKRLKNLEESKFLPRDDGLEDEKSNWIFKRAKYREEKHHKPMRNGRKTQENV